MIKSKFKYLVISDLHLGHHRIPVGDMIGSYIDFIMKNKKVRDIDVLFINGDVFDRYLTTNSVTYKEIISFLTLLLIYCGKNKIDLYILEGTPSHDWGQCAIVGGLNTQLQLNIEFKYINELSILHLDKYGIDILFIPDEWKPTPSEVIRDVKTVMMDAYVTQVALIMMHGQFIHQLPDLDLISSHTESDYQPLAKYLIHIGHIHKQSQYENIIANGSLDRLAHGEEESKGGILATIYANGKSKIEFIDNLKATQFVTIPINNKSINTLSTIIVKICKKSKRKVFIRLDFGGDVIDQDLFKVLVIKFPDVRITVKDKKKRKMEKDLNFVPDVVLDTFDITYGNIESLILKELGKISPSDELIFKSELMKVK